MLSRAPSLNHAKASSTSSSKSARASACEKSIDLSEVVPGLKGMLVLRFLHCLHETVADRSARIIVETRHAFLLKIQGEGGREREREREC